MTAKTAVQSSGLLFPPETQFPLGNSQPWVRVGQQAGRGSLLETQTGGDGSSRWGGGGEETALT